MAKKATSKKKPAYKPSSGSEKTANWPGLPGGKQKKDRGLGLPKVKQAVMEEF